MKNIVQTKIEILNTQKNWEQNNLKNNILTLLRDRLKKTEIRIVKATPYMLVYYVDIQKQLDKDIKEFLLILLGHMPESETNISYEHFSSIKSCITQESMTMASHAIFYCQTPQSIQDEYKECFDNMVFQQSSDLQYILESEASKKMITLLSRKTPKTLQSPFKYLGPVSPEFFVGRESIISEILDSDTAGFAITGGRRIGKSSLLHKISDEISRGRKSKTYLNNKIMKIPYDSCFIDCICHETFQDVYNEIFYKMNLREFLKGSLRSIKDLIDKTPSLKNNKLLLLFDEMDDLMDMNSYQYIDALNFAKDLQASSRHVKFVITGFRNISEIIHNAKHPFYNLCKGMYLKAFKKKHVHRFFILSRMKSNVNISSFNEFILRIFELSGGYPSVMQFIADQLIKHSDNHIITPEMVDLVMNKEETIDFVRKTIMGNTTPLERLICILASEDPSNITENKLIAKIREQNLQLNDTPKKVYDSLKYLCNNCIMQEENNKFRFLYPLIPIILNRDMKDSKQSLIDEVKQ